jgi:hypothetical protein
MKRRSPKRQATIDARPAIATISDSREPVRPHDENLREFVRRLPCVVCMAPTLRGDPCHWRTVARHGDWLEVDGVAVGNIFPGCRLHHAEQHQVGIRSWPARHGLDLGPISAAVGRAYLGGWSADGLAAAVLTAKCYTRVDLSLRLDGGLPF